MTKSVFDAGSFIEVNLKEGTISSRENDRLALIPTEVLEMLPASEPVFQAAAKWGKLHGVRLGDHLSTEGDAASVEALAEHLGGTLAALGLGRVRLEIRGDALMFRVTDEPLLEKRPGTRTLLQGFLSGYLTALTGRPFTVLDLGQVHEDRLFWALNPGVAEVAQAKIENGEDPMAVVDAALGGRPSC